MSNCPVATKGSVLAISPTTFALPIPNSRDSMHRVPQGSLLFAAGGTPCRVHFTRIFYGHPVHPKYVYRVHYPSLGTQELHTILLNAKGNWYCDCPHCKNLQSSHSHAAPPMLPSSLVTPTSRSMLSSDGLASLASICELEAKTVAAATHKHNQTRMNSHAHDIIDHRGEDARVYAVKGPAEELPSSSSSVSSADSKRTLESPPEVALAPMPIQQYEAMEGSFQTKRCKADPMAEHKRRMNAEAARRFRARKQEKTMTQEGMLHELQAKVAYLTHKLELHESEKQGWLMREDFLKRRATDLEQLIEQLSTAN